MFRGFLDHRLGKWRNALKRKEYQRRWDNYYYHFNAPTARSEALPQKLIVSRPTGTNTLNSASHLGSKLVSLPAEVRILIWAYVLGGNHIALHTNEYGRLVYDLLQDTNTQTPARNNPVQIETIMDATKVSNRANKHGKQPRGADRLGALAVLQTCRLM